MACYFSNSELLASSLQAASKAVSDPSWRLPLHAGYRSRLSSSVADIRNVPSDGGQGGAITAALFLERFVKEGTEWVHFDVNGEDGGKGEAQGLRAAYELVKEVAEREML